MSAPDAAKAVLIDGKFYKENRDGSFQPIDGETDWKQLRTKTEADIEAAALDDDDALPLSDEEWIQAIRSTHKHYIHIGVDNDVLDWFKSQGPRGYQTKINAVLRQYVEAQKKAG